MRSKYDVSLVITGEKLSLRDLSALLEREAQSGSHDKGDLRLDGSPWKTTVWRHNSTEPDASLEMQCDHLLDSLPLKYSDLRKTREDELTANLNIAIFFETAYASVSLPATLIHKVAKAGIGIAITTYPCGAEDESATT